MCDWHYVLPHSFHQFHSFILRLLMAPTAVCVVHFHFIRLALCSFAHLSGSRRRRFVPPITRPHSFTHSPPHFAHSLLAETIEGLERRRPIGVRRRAAPPGTHFVALVAAASSNSFIYSLSFIIIIIIPSPPSNTHTSIGDGDVC